MLWNSPGQLIKMQFSMSVSFPAQSLPLFCGRGLSHVRSLILSPEPHDSEQADQFPQDVQAPSTR